jgi:hypothetical protein
LVVDLLHNAGLIDADSAALDRGQRPWRNGFGVRGELALEQRPRVLRDRGDDRYGADRLGDVVDVAEEHDHACEHEAERCGDGELGHERVDLRGATHRAERDQRVDEGRDEHSERDLDDPVPEEGPQDSWGELTAGQRQHHDGDREHQAGEGDHRGDDR